MKKKEIRHGEPIKRSRKPKSSIDSLPISQELIRNTDKIARSLAKKIDREEFERKTAPVKDVLALVGAGAFVAASVALPGLPMALKPFLKNPYDPKAWKRFNLLYLKRTLERLEKDKFIEISEKNGKQQVTISERGRHRILKFALDEISIDKPKHWDGTWRLVSYDVPEHLREQRTVFRNYLRSWGFYPLHESAFLHAYPCTNEITFLREYLRIGKYVRIFYVSAIENDTLFRDFFGI